MEHEKWVRKALYSATQSLGFHYTPKDEIRRRILLLRAGMEKSGIEAALINQKMDFFYFTGTTQNGHLFIPVEGEPLLLIRRERERALIETPLETVADIKSMRDLQRRVRQHQEKIPETLGLELDVLPVKDYFKYQDLFPEAKIMDIAGVIRDLRKIKSPFEAGLMRKAGEIGQQVYREARTFLKSGMSEIEFAGLMEATAKRYGHEGLLRVRDINYEAYTWHVLGGPNGGIVSQSDSPMGGLGLSPAFPVGASLRPMRAREPILVDFGICYHGYQIDETRMFSIGKMPDKFFDAYKACVEIHDAVLEETRPGMDCEHIFRKTVKMAKKLGYSDSFLGPAGLQTRFVGHGVGLELGELPYLAQGHSYPLEQGMTFAVEPKIVFPGEGSVGIENTVWVTGDGYEVLTPLEQVILEV